MKFEEVIPLLRAGKKVRRPSWDVGQYFYLNDAQYLQYTDGGSYVSCLILAREDFEEMKEEPNPIFEETIQWFRPEDKLPNGGENVLCLIETKYHNGLRELEVKMSREPITDIYFCNCKITKWAYAPKGERWKSKT